MIASVFVEIISLRHMYCGFQILFDLVLFEVGLATLFTTFDRLSNIKYHIVGIMRVKHYGRILFLSHLSAYN